MSTAVMGTQVSSGQDDVMLELRGVCKRYGGQVDAVACVDLRVRRGEFMFLLGPSGSGKTTTLRMIAGFAQPTGGHILLAGRQIDGVPAHQRDIGMVFQRYALFPHLSVYDNVAFGLRMRGMPEKERPPRVRETLGLVRLDGLEKRYPHELSGGQQQRVALARALAYRPSLLLLDEPLANLDRRLRDEMRIELKRIQQEMGTTMLFVTHDQEEALSLGDRIAVMNEGRIEQVSSPTDVYRSPASRFVAGFIGDMNFLSGRVESASERADHSIVRLDLGGGPQEVVGRFEAGSAMVACIRPECVRVRPADSDAPGVIGTIRYVGFGGDSVRCVVASSDGTEMLSRMSADGAERIPAVGDQVRIEWDKKSLNAFPS